MMLSDELEWCGILVDYLYQLFGSDVMLHFSNYVPMKKQTHLEWPEGEYIFSKHSILGEQFL